METNVSSNNICRDILNNNDLRISQTHLQQLIYELEYNDLLIIKGKELIILLKEDYVRLKYIHQNEDFIDWVKPVIINNLLLENYYIINSSLTFEPVQMIEYIKQTECNYLKIPSDQISEYFNLDHLIIASENSESITFYVCKYIDFYDYFSAVTNESVNQCYERLSTHSINLDEKFIEVSFNNIDYYKNINDLTNSSSLITFINEIFGNSKLKKHKALIIKR